VSLALAAVSLALILLGAALTDQTKAVREDAERDALTGLKMRGPFEAQAIAMLNRARDKDVPVSVIVADIDHFKRVNDIWGHQVGDTAIASFGDLLRSTIRDTDIAGRIGGEEFCILVWNCPEEPTLNLAERIRARFEQLPIEGISDDVRLTASFGVAQWVTDEGYGRLFARADAALYRAKEGGRNCTSADGDDRPRAVVSPLKQGPDPREVRA
jgi:diguanylate cyclase (GGDEF)-like protein